jgi:hypothetical protein
MGIPDPVVNVAAAIVCSPFHEVKLHRWPSTVLLYLLKLGIVASEEQATVVVVHGVGQPCKLPRWFSALTVQFEDALYIPPSLLQFSNYFSYVFWFFAFQVG